MTTTRPNVKPEALYQLGEAATLLGIGQSTLHRYTERGLCKASIRRSNGRRVWKGAELLKLWNIVY